MTRHMMRSALMASMLALVASACAQAQVMGALGKSPGADASCDRNVPLITQGYGAPGPYQVEKQSLDLDGSRADVEVYLPTGVAGKVPVIFFSHAYGPNMSSAYTQLINHVVSRGAIFVYAPYPMLRASNAERYDTLWRGFQTAVQRYGARMDLGRVGFVGHSFGGGANPAMTLKGLAQGWGSQGAFMLELAPWYTYEVTNASMAQIPSRVLHAVQVYDRDTINDHRMAIDLYTHMQTSTNLFLMVRTQAPGGCELVADHSTPGRSESVALKQYALFRPLDALADAAFTGSPAAHQALMSMVSAPAVGYQPLELQSRPQPMQPESYYSFAWGNERNERD